MCPKKCIEMYSSKKKKNYPEIEILSTPCRLAAKTIWDRLRSDFSSCFGRGFADEIVYV